jgi:hypothetical protein
MILLPVANKQLWPRGRRGFLYLACLALRSVRVAVQRTSKLLVSFPDETGEYMVIRSAAAAWLVHMSMIRRLSYCGAIPYS